MPAKHLSYLLKGIDRRLWTRVKVRSAEDQITIKELITRAVKSYLDLKPRRDSNDH